MDCATAKIHIYRNSEEVAAQAAGWLHHLASASTGDFSIALSGGSTPKRLYEILARPPYLKRFPWQRVHWFWSDERFVPPDHPDSNYRMACAAMLDAVSPPPGNIHPVNTDLDTPAAAAGDYEQMLRRYYGNDRLDPGKALFDIVLLGVGEDGHAASLFPHAPALAETTLWVAPVIGFRPEPRVTLTFPSLRSSAHCFPGLRRRETADRIHHLLRRGCARRPRSLRRRDPLVLGSGCSPAMSGLWRLDQPTGSPLGSIQANVLRSSGRTSEAYNLRNRSWSWPGA